MLCLQAHPQAWADLPLRTQVPLVLFEERPWLDTTPCMTGVAWSCQGRCQCHWSPATMLAAMVASRATHSFLLLTILPLLEHRQRHLARG